MTQYHITKPSKAHPEQKRTIRKFNDYELAVRWACRYIFPEDKQLFIQDDTGKYLATVTYDYVEPLVEEY